MAGAITPTADRTLVTGGTNGLRAAGAITPTADRTFVDGCDETSVP
jgi:hypothetical protein